MFVVVAGGGKVGSNVARSLRGLKHEVVLIEQDRHRWERLAEEFEHAAILGDATELYVLDQAGLGRPPSVVVAVTGDDEDNLVICQLAKEKYGVDSVVARVNDPRNQQLFDLLEISPTVSATTMVLALIEHEVPEHEVVHLLPLRRENLEIVEVEVGSTSLAAGKRIEQLKIPPSARLLSVMRNGKAEIAVGSTRLEAGDQVLAVLEPGGEPELCRLLLSKKK
jgi:trk system potassium uptake protein TrkA